jgi:hypothetical protein
MVIVTSASAKLPGAGSTHDQACKVEAGSAAAARNAGGTIAPSDTVVNASAAIA